MTRTVFFSFHYDNDHWRANVVRNAWVTKPDREEAGYIDGADWEEIKQQGDPAIKEWIAEQMEGCSVTAVLIGSDTYGRKWVDHEIRKSYSDGMGLVGIRIHRLKDQDGNTTAKGDNPLNKWKDSDTGESLSDIFNTYDWILDKGEDNIGDWVEEAAQIANR